MSMWNRLSQLLAREKLLLQQHREIAALRAEVEQLRAHSEKIKRAMRRCLSCDYRLDAIAASSLDERRSVEP
jgi:hypothetical protein